MRLGCSGCLALLGSVVVVTILIGGALWAAMGILEDPALGVVSTSQADWVSARKKLQDIARTGDAQPGSTYLTEREATALVSRELAEAGELPFSAVSVRLPGNGLLEVSGRLPLRVVLTETPLARGAAWLPASWLERSVWMRLRAHPRVERRGDRRYVRFDVDAFTLGRTWLPAFVPRLILDPSTLRFLSMPIPSSVDDVTAESGRLVIRSGD